MPEKKKKSQGQGQTKIGRILTKAGNIADAVVTLATSPGLLGKIRGGVQLVRAIMGNDRAWYTKYVDIRPAANYDRPMDALFNKSITRDATAGASCRFVDIETEWTGYSQTYMFDQVTTAAFRKLRDDLRSNLPYNQNMLKVFLIQSIAIAIAAKQLERDIQWNQFSHPTVRNFNKMWRLKSNSEGYGISTLVPISYLNDGDANDWASTVSNYDILAPLFNSIIRLPDSLGRFISHYFGSVFIDSDDGYADQFIRLYVDRVDWAEYDSSNQTIQYSQLELQAITVERLINLVNKMQIDFAIVLADLIHSNQLVPSHISMFGQYMYVAVYDESLKQALINGYTSSSAVTPSGYVRLDKMSGVSDDLTQFIFMGALQDNNSNTTLDLTNVPAITILNMTLKFDSDVDLDWPAGLEQASGSNGVVHFDSPIGISITSDIQADTYVAVDVSGNSFTVPFGTFNGSSHTITCSEITFNVSGETDSVVVESLGFGNNVGENATLFLPICCEGYSSNSNRLYTVTCYGIIVNLNLTNMTVSVKSGSFSQEYGLSAANRIEVHNEAVRWARSRTQSVLAATSGYVQNPTSNFQAVGKDGNPVTIVPSSSNGWTAGQQALINLLQIELTQSYILSGTFKTYNISYGFSGANDLIWDFGSSTTTREMVDDVNFIMMAECFSGQTSGTSAVYTTSTSAQTVSVTPGFALLAGWVADQFDAHLPMVLSNRITLNVYADGFPPEVVIDNGHTLIKESYIPYWYNVNDLRPTLYNMFTSLFETVNLSSLGKRDTGKSGNTQKKSK